MNPLCPSRLPRLLLVLLLAAATSSFAKPDDSIPPAVAKGLQAYEKDGFAAAIDIWIKNSVMDGNAAAKGQMLQISEVERYYGKYEGYQLVRTSLLTPRTRRFYFALYYEKSPLWVFFDVYERKTGEFTISEMLFNTKASLILPGDIFYQR